MHTTKVEYVDRDSNTKHNGLQLLGLEKVYIKKYRSKLVKYLCTKTHWTAFRTIMSGCFLLNEHYTEHFYI